MEVALRRPGLQGDVFGPIDGEDFCYASDVAGLAAVRNLAFDPIAPGEGSVISSCNIAQAYLQSDMFPETDPPRFLKVRDPVSGLFRYFRQRFIWLVKFCSALAAHPASLPGIHWFCSR